MSDRIVYSIGGYLMLIMMLGLICLNGGACIAAKDRIDSLEIKLTDLQNQIELLKIGNE